MSRHPTARAGTKMLERYRIERELGRGGMGVVYVATDENTGRLVALKTTSVAQLGSGEKSRNQRRERFVREVRALTQVNHENVVHVFDAGECDDADLGWLLFYTMEYVEGTTLASLVQEHGALNGGEAAAIVMQVAAGLGEAHAQGIIHRDVKPANIFLSVDGRAKIGDFGIAKIEGSTQITRRDQLVGTPNYLAPEQILGDAVGPQTDVFALGALFFVITQNKPLRQQVDAGSLLASANGNEPVARMMAATNLSEGLKRVVARSLERDPSRRYVDGAAFADALAEHATRAPTLPGGMVRPDFLAEGTQDRSSAFLSSNPNTDESAGRSGEDDVNASVPEAEDADIEALDDVSSGDANSIEAIAAAMLGEVERRATGTFKVPSTKAGADEPLPVARTESTVMFNLRAMEDEHNERSGRSAPAPGPSLAPMPPSSTSNLPVARTEPTAMFRLDQLEQQQDAKAPAARPRIELEPVSDEGAAVASQSWDDATRENDVLTRPPSVPPSAPIASTTTPSTSTMRPAIAVNPLRRVNSKPNIALDAPTMLDEPTSMESTLPTKTLTPKPTVSLLTKLKMAPRGALLAATLAVGLLFGIGLAVALRPRAQTVEEVPLDVEPLAERPALCPVRTPTPETQAQGAAMLDDALALKRDGASPTKIVDRLREGIAADPTNALLFYELGRQVSGKEQDDADECVCQLAPESKECSAVEKARGK